MEVTLALGQRTERVTIAKDATTDKLFEAAASAFGANPTLIFRGQKLLKSTAINASPLAGHLSLAAWC